MSDFLDKIIAAKQARISDRREYLENIRTRLSISEYTRYHLFRRQISRPGRLNLIAEIKKASPSKGIIRDDFDPLILADIYEKSGAAAISVLTEEQFFLGKPAYLKGINEKYATPTLMKDFIIDELQIFEARYCGASAILLIMALLSDDRYTQLSACAARLDLDVLTEVHDEAEMRRAIDLGADIIGVNNRDLRTFKVDIATSERLIPKIPKDRVTVAESGISSHDDILRLKVAGAQAVLIGETFLRERNVAAKIKDVMHGSQG